MHVYVLLKLNFFNRRNLNGQVVVIMKKRVAFKWWMPVGFLSAFVCCLSLAHVVVITDGYYKTCEQYRRNLIQILGSGGREIQVRDEHLVLFFPSKIIMFQK